MDSGEMIFKLIRSAISGDKLTDTSNIDWDKIYMTAQAHSIANLIAYAIDNMLNKPPQNVADAFNSIRDMNILRESAQQLEAELMLDMMETEGVDNMPLKGFITKNLYPSPDMRTMCDVDVLIRDGCMDKAEKIMQELGYPVREESGREIVYKRPPYLSFELHRAFVSEKYQKTVFDYYKNIWDRALLSAGKKHIYELTKEDFYIYMIVHISKHYMTGGIGIRAFLDVYIYLEKYAGVLDREYLDNEFQKINLLEFCKNTERLAYVWFAGRAHNAATASMEEFILSGGTYGSKVHGDAAYALREGGSKHTGLKKKLSVIFPPYENMCYLYPKLKGKALLLPFYWVYRIIDRSINKRENIKTALTYTATESDIDYLKLHLTEVGLI